MTTTENKLSALEKFDSDVSSLDSVKESLAQRDAARDALNDKAQDAPPANRG